METINVVGGDNNHAMLQLRELLKDRELSDAIVAKNEQLEKEVVETGIQIMQNAQLIVNQRTEEMVKERLRGIDINTVQPPLDSTYILNRFDEAIDSSKLVGRTIQQQSIRLEVRKSKVSKSKRKAAKKARRNNRKGK